MTLEHRIEWTDDKVARLWDYYSRTPPFSEIYFAKLFGDQILRKSHLRLDQPLSILDFGCGPGHLVEHLKRLRSRWYYTGLDFSSLSVAQTRAKAAEYGSTREVIHVERLPSPLPADTYDVVVMIEVLEHLRDEHLHAATAEARRLLRPGGALLVTTPNNEDLGKSNRLCPECGAVFHEWQHVRSWDAHSLALHLGQYGFIPDTLSGTDFMASRFPRRAIHAMRRLLNRQAPAPHLIGVFRTAPSTGRG